MQTDGLDRNLACVPYQPQPNTEWGANVTLALQGHPDKLYFNGESIKFDANMSVYEKKIDVKSQSLFSMSNTVRFVRISKMLPTPDKSLQNTTLNLKGSLNIPSYVPSTIGHENEKEAVFVLRYFAKIIIVIQFDSNRLFRFNGHATRRISATQEIRIYPRIRSNDIPVLYHNPEEIWIINESLILLIGQMNQNINPYGIITVPFEVPGHKKCFPVMLKIVQLVEIKAKNPDRQSKKYENEIAAFTIIPGSLYKTKGIFVKPGTDNVCRSRKFWR
ncbi:hypothetical protein ACOME3_002222 [Neoechinorhynchus agilis]